MRWMIHLLIAATCIAAPAYAAEDERSVQAIRIPPGKQSVAVRGRVEGYRYIDYQFEAAAGQRLRVRLIPGKRSSQFNVLPPDSTDAAMYIAGGVGQGFDGRLPDDGVYTIRVYLVRAAARRKESSDFTLTVGLSGKALPPVSGQIDAQFPGTRFHARTTVPCQPPYTEIRECEAWVVRRGFDGTATVVLRWGDNGIRRILFAKGKPVAGDSPRQPTHVRDERGYRVSFDGDEHYEVPEPLVFGG